MIINEFLGNIDLIILSEINIKSEENDFYEIDGFNSEYFNRRTTKGGGIVVFIKDNIRYERIEGVFISYESIVLNIKRGNLEGTIVSVYRPPRLNVNQFVQELSDNLDKIDKKKNLIVNQCKENK